MILPSKELLSKVMGREIRVVAGITVSNTLKFNNDDKDNLPQEINIYELMHMMKEWARDLGFSISTSPRINGGYTLKLIDVRDPILINHIRLSEEPFDIFETELNGVTKACERILKEQPYLEL